jgi:uncharacterized protein (TIGR00730 family)
MLSAVSVFCGSSFGGDPVFTAAAAELGRELARRGCTVVYGGGRVGLMGVVADAALDAGGRAIGVIPRFLFAREVGHPGLTELELVDTLAERKRRMGDRSDAYLVLPGGVGTMDELFEVWSWSQLGVERKPCGLLNVAGYYDELIAFLDRAAAQGFIKPQHRALLATGRTVPELLDLLEERKPATQEQSARV